MCNQTVSTSTTPDRDQPVPVGLREALAACRAGDTLVVTKLDRLAAPFSTPHDIVGELTSGGVKLNIGGSVHDPDDPVGRLLFNVLAMIAEFESDLIRMRTREGMKVARAKGRLRGKQPKLKPTQEAHLVELWRAGQHTSAELAELFSVARSTGPVDLVGVGPAEVMRAALDLEELDVLDQGGEPRGRWRRWGRMRSSVPWTTRMGTSIWGRSARKSVSQVGTHGKRSVGGRAGSDVEARLPRLVADPGAAELSTL